MSKSDVAISIKGLSKAYKIAHNNVRRATFRDALMDRMRHPFRRPSEETFWALNDVSFDVKKGEVVGIIGRNGAGKSTLLKILSRIAEPTRGRVELYGRVGSLLEVGTGFHPELTGRENIHLNGAILGMSRGEIRKQFEAIVDFAEVEKFLDTPVKHYSSGMYVRLAFSVAAHLNPEILIVDEVLAVGDGEFQRKCLGKMDQAAQSGRTVLLVSHNMTAVESLCSRCVWLDAGALRLNAETDNALNAYREHYLVTSQATQPLSSHIGRMKGLVPVMTTASLMGADGRPTTTVLAGSRLSVQVAFDWQRAPMRPVLGVVIKTAARAPVFGVDNRTIGGFRLPLGTGHRTIICHFDELPLMPGRYLIDLYLGDESRTADVVIDALSFEVTACDVFGTGKLPSSASGPILWRARWSLLD
jgi:lipopolysaccharide transport system ATP-binding protein